MSVTHDNSVLFSLNQLMDLYETRVQEEQQEAAQKAAVEERAREEAKRLEQERAARKAHEEALHKAREDAAQKEEAARLEAMRLAAVEQVRVEAEQRARIEVQKRAQDHELALESLRHDEKKRRLTRAIWTGAACGTMALVGVVGLYFGKIKPDNEGRLAQQAADINAQFEDTRRLEAQNAANRKRIAQAESLLEQAKKPIAIEAAPVATTKDAPRPVNAANTTVKPPTKRATCLPGEPGCDFNGNRIF